MSINTSGVVFFQMLLALISSLIMCFISFIGKDDDVSSLIYPLSLAFITFIYILYIRHISGIGKYAISLTLFFVLSFIIVFFQTPVDFLLGQYSDNTLYATYVHDESILVASVWYAVSFFISIALGMHYQAVKLNSKPATNNVQHKSLFITEKPFFYLFYLFFILHIFTIDLGYYQANTPREGLSGLSISILGYFVILLPVCIGISSYNLKLKTSNNRKNLGIVEYIKNIPLPFLVIVIIFSSFTFLAGDRGPAIRALTVIFCGYYIATNKKESYLKFIIIIIAAGSFLSTIKLIGAININDDLIGSFLSARQRLSENSRFESISPYTSELAGSFRAYNIAFSLWSSNISLYGASLITGILMAIPYAVSLVMNIFNLEHEQINTAQLITTYSNEVYGLGTTLIGDLLLNFGPALSILVAFLIGRLFLKFDYHFYIRLGSIYIHIIGMYFLMISIGLSRSSIFPTIGNSIFIVMMLFIISKLNKGTR